VAELGEFLPLFFGCVLAALAGPHPSLTRLRGALALCIVLGPMASLINGEIGERSFLAIFDVAQVLLAFGLVQLALARLVPARRRS